MTKIISPPIRVSGPVLLLSLLCSFHLIEAAPVDLTPPVNTVGYADHNGHLRYIHRFGDVVFSDAFTLPIRFDFSSRRVVDGDQSLFGWHGWACGAIESHAELLQEGKVLQIQLLCAKTMILEKVDGEDGLYRTGDGQWTGHLLGEEISVRRKDGWDLVFESGRVSRLTTDKGRVIRWNRDASGHLLSVHEEGTEKPQLTVVWEDGRISHLSTELHSFRFQFRDSLLSAVEWLSPEGVETRFSCRQSETSLNLETPSLQEYRFSWLADKGIILGDGINRYSLTSRGVPGGGPGVQELTMTRPDGSSASFQPGEPTGSLRQKDVSGNEILTTKVAAEGPSQGGVLKVEWLREDAETQLLTSHTYDEKGKIVERFWYGNLLRHPGYNEGRIDAVLFPDRNFAYDTAELVDGAAMHRIQFEYGDDNALKVVSVDQKPTLRFDSDDQGRITAVVYEGRFRRSFTYAESGEVTESLELPEAATSPFWYLDHEGGGIGPDLIIESVRDDAGRLLRQRYADYRVLEVEYDSRERRVSDITVARDGKTRIRSVTYVYGERDQVLRIDENLLTRNTNYDDILINAVGSNVSGSRIPREIALSRTGEGTKNP